MCATPTVWTLTHWFRTTERLTDMSNLPPNELRILLHLKRSHCKQTVHNNKRQILIDELDNNIYLHIQWNRWWFCHFVNMEVDDDKMDKSKGTNQMEAVFKSVIECSLGVMEVKSVAKIELVFKMITNNLTYEDPGMFYKTLIREERDRQMQDTTVMWLLNQVISLSNKFELYRWVLQRIRIRFFFTTNPHCSWFQFTRNHWIAKIHIVRQFHETTEIIL